MRRFFEGYQPCRSSSSGDRYRSTGELALKLFYCRARIFTFVTSNASNITESDGKGHVICPTLDKAVKEITGHEVLFVVTDANARTGWRAGGFEDEDRTGIGTHGQDTPNDKGERELRYRSRPCAWKTFTSNPEHGVSHTFYGRDKKYIDDTRTGQRTRTIGREVAVYPNSHSYPFRTTTPLKQTLNCLNASNVISRRGGE